MISRRVALGAALGASLASVTRVVRAEDRRVPALFVSHGSPRLAYEPARRAPLRAWGATLPVPAGIVVMTPHFASRRASLGRVGPGAAMFNLPPMLAARIPPTLGYATPSNVELAARVAACLKTPYAAVTGRPGFDHTTWIPLAQLFPRADVPVVELGYPYWDDRALFDLGRALAPLRDERVMFVGSGGLTHNLASVDFDFPPDAPIPSFSSEFDAWAVEALDRSAIDELVDWRHKAPAAELAHPDDGAHFRVLLVALGMATANGARPVARYPVVGYESTLSIRCVELG